MSRIARSVGGMMTGLSLSEVLGELRELEDPASARATRSVATATR